MPDYREEVTVAVNLKSEGIESTLTKLGTALTTIKSSANSIGDELDEIEQSVEGFEPDVDESDIEIGGEVDTTSIMNAVAKSKVTAEEFIDIAGPANIKIGARLDQSRTFVDDIINEMDLANQAAEEGQVLAPVKDEISKSNRNLSDSAQNSVKELQREKTSFSDIIKEGQSLTTVKQKVANANENVQKMSRESAREIAGEDDEMMNLFRSLGVVEEAMDETGDAFGSTSRAIRQMRRRTDDTSDSIRAAAQVGDLFEEGLGSLSVNLGAFTIALRNFLTQVPLLLTGLGALGSAALAAASAFVTLGVAIAGIAGAGALASAMAIKGEFSEIESLGESLQVIFLNIRDSLLELVRPLTEIENAVSFFERFVTGTLQAASSLVTLVESLTRGTDAFNELASSTAVDSMYSIGDAMSDIGEKVGPQFEELVGALRFSFLVLGEETVDVLAQITGGLANAIVFSTQLLDRVDNLSGAISDFGSTIAELAELGKTIGGGLLPIFRAFTSVMQSVAGALNDVDGETLQNLITFVALTAALNKLAGAASVVVTILPNLVVGLSNVGLQAKSASGALGTLRAATAAAGTQIGTFINQISLLGGFTALMAAITGTETRLRRIAFSSKAADKMFEELGDEIGETTDDLRQLAVEGKLADKTLSNLGDDSDFDSSRFNLEETTDGKKVSTAQFLPDVPLSKLLFGGVEEEAKDAQTTLSDFTGDVASGSDGASKRLRNIVPSIESVKTGMGDLRKNVGSSVAAFFRFQAQLATVIPLLIATAAKSLYLGASKLFETKSIYEAAGAMSTYLKTSKGTAAAHVRATMATIAQTMANHGLASSATLASVSLASMAAMLFAVSGGVALLLAVVGGLAVGIITNFDKIKSAAGGMFETIKTLASAVADVLLTYFVTSWNVIVDVIQAVIQGISPLTDMFTDLISQLGLFGDGADSMGMIASAASFAKGVISGLGTVFGVVADILGGLLTIFTTIIRIGLTPIIVYIQLVTTVLQTLIGAFLNFIGVEGGVGSLASSITSFISSMVEEMKAIPQMMENITNRFIDGVNAIFAVINEKVPGINLGQVDNISLTSDGLKTDRDDLSSSTGPMMDSLRAKMNPSVSYEENNQTNVNQTIDADPEDKSTVSRVVEDAIERANRFDRTRAGQ